MSRPLRAALIAVAVAVLAVTVRHVDFGAYASVAGMRALVEAWGPFGPLVFIGVFVAGFFIPGPEILFAALGVVLFGPVAGFVYAFLAAMIGTTVTFAIVRYTAQDYMQKAMRDRFASLRALDDRLEHQGVRTVALLRLLLFLSPPLNWALGASRVPMWRYMLGTALGILPGLTMTSYLADMITEAGSTADLLSPGILLPVLGVVVFVGAGVVFGRRFLGRSPAK
ncbi:MAG TPA: VTT domain-containing protein [Candidatus Binatia bacterium]|jgi:uncharacterized membrane protein YdjX (TVP38/TMEM64 family)|nr:VTT domain-containing protein [Candidatus Binatia bacterium]